jgi:hypothetical protein
MVEGCGGLIGDHGYWIKEEVARDSNLGCRSLERRQPKFAAPGGLWSLGFSCGFRGCGYRVIDHGWGQVAELFMEPPVVVVAEPFFQTLAQGRQRAVLE